MNVSTAANPPSTPSTQTQGAAKNDPARETSRRPDDADRGEQRAAFESALRARSRGEDNQGDRDGQKEPADGALAGFFPGHSVFPPPLRAQAVMPSQTAPAGAVELNGTRKAIEAALSANVPQPVTAVGDADPAAIWEASVRDPNAVAVDVRIVRGERLAQQDAAPLNVTVGSSQVNAEVLARHAPRLNERLRKHAVGFTHVRIEGDRPDEDGQ